ncbi:helix-turn-helix transcriptional regulator [Sphingorhabdus lutea]|nr:LuxR family transcriptional regulator [Sphingorhabdus lutea]
MPLSEKSIEVQTFLKACLNTPKNPRGIIKNLLKSSRSLKSNYCSYYIEQALSPNVQNLGHFYTTSRHKIYGDVSQADLLSRTRHFHQSIMVNGETITDTHLDNVVNPKFPTWRRKLFNRLKELDVTQFLIIPLFGAKFINGCITFGFNDKVNLSDEILVKLLEHLSMETHKQMVIFLDVQDAPVELSPREKEILGWMAAGKSKMDISQIISLSPSSVDTYIRRIYKKLNVHNKSDAFAVANSYGYLLEA